MNLRITITLLLLIYVGSAGAQTNRYELGRRLRSMERAWDKQPDPETRARASRHLNDAVQSFFRTRTADAARALDEATLVLRNGEAAISTTERWVAALDVVPERRLVDAAQTSLPITIQPSYKTEPPIIERIGVHISLLGDDDIDDLRPTTFELKTGSLPHQAIVDLRGVAPGDHTLHAAFYSGPKLVGRAEVSLSIVEGLDARLAACREMLNTLADAPVTTPLASARGLLAQLDALVAQQMLETDIPAARRLQALEDVIETLKNKSGGWLRGQRGDLWASVALAGTTRTVPVRLYIPPIQDETKPLPLVVALHGAGGSENMFFDGYGDGAIVRLCRRRGWLLVAPRSGMLGAAPVDELLDALVAELPVDRTRVFLVGHSMGAAQAVSIAAHRPERYAAVAALGGGGRFGKTSDAFRALPFFIGVGTDDFLLRGAQELKQALERAGTARVEVREYDKIEHLAIVQVALGDVFAFFDTVNRGVAPRQ